MKDAILFTLVLFMVFSAISCKTFRQDHKDCLTPNDIKSLQYTQELRTKSGKLTAVHWKQVSELSCNGLYQLEFKLAAGRTVNYFILKCNNKILEPQGEKGSFNNEQQYQYFVNKCGDEFSKKELEYIQESFSTAGIFIDSN